MASNDIDIDRNKGAKCDKFIKQMLKSLNQKTLYYV